MNVDVLIVGAGIAGLACAKELKDKGLNVLVLEKGRGIGGRMSSRRYDSNQGTARFDHGAQYINVRSHEGRQSIEAGCQDGYLKTWFDHLHYLNGTIDERPATRYIGSTGMNQQLKAWANDLTVLTKQRVNQVTTTTNGFRVKTESKQTIEAQQVVVTAPIPQALELTEGHLTEAESRQLKSVEYAPCLSLMVQLDGPSGMKEPGGFKSNEEESVIGWLADNHVKGISERPGALTIQGSPAYSEEAFDAPEETITNTLWEAAKPHITNHTILETRLQRWRYSLCTKGLESPYLQLQNASGLFVCGDAFGGAGKVETALLSGLAVAKKLTGSY